MFKYDAIKPLLGSGNMAIEYFVKRDLLGEDAGDIRAVWELPEVKGILRKQQPDGSFSKGGLKDKLVETWRQMRFLVQMYETDRAHTGTERAAEYLFSCQTDEGDIRGFLGNQYAPYYTGSILYLMIKAGYEDDARVAKGIKWLLSMRQEDGGWFAGSPGMIKRTWSEQAVLTSGWRENPERDFDFSLPFSAAGTGMAIRALAAHSKWRHSEEAEKAARLLKSKFFKKDNYPYMGTPQHWVRFNFPYWWNDALSALDMISLIGIPKEDEDAAAALEWFLERQQPDGLWKGSYSDIHKESGSRKEWDLRLWVSLNILRVFKRYYGEIFF